MTFILIGLVVGCVMGLTGAGGALVSLPLFTNLLGTSLKEATVLSLVAVALGTAVNLIGQFRKVRGKLALPLALSGVIANYGTLFLKPYAPDVLVAGLIILIGAVGLRTVWAGTPPATPLRDADRTILKAAAAGALLGSLTTFTGLGGGVILLPLLINGFGISYREALPTGLAIVLLISVSAFWFQSDTALKLIGAQELLQLTVGALVAYIFLQQLIRRVDSASVETLTKLTFTMVTLYSMIGVLMKTL